MTGLSAKPNRIGRLLLVAGTSLVFGLLPLVLFAPQFLGGSPESRSRSQIVPPPPPEPGIEDVTRMPLCPDAPPRQALSNPVTIGSNTYVDTEVFNISLAEAIGLLPSARVPQRPPSWATCSISEVSLDQDGRGSLIVNFYEGGFSGPRAVEFQVTDVAPPFPPPCISCPPMGTWVAIPGHPGFYQDSGATGGEATGHRIAWTDAAGRFFDLHGAISLDEALAIASSVPGG